MLRTLYRAMVISRAKSAAYQTLAMLSDRELADIGYSRASFVDAYIANIVAEMEQTCQVSTCVCLLCLLTAALVTTNRRL